MPIKTVTTLQRLIQQAVVEMEARREPMIGGDRALTRAVALLWAAHDELAGAIPRPLAAAGM